MTHFRILLVLCLAGLAACATPIHKPPVKDTAVATKLPTGEGWWYARFRVLSEPDKEPLWYIDDLIAGEIIAPLFEHHFQDIHIWRVHRRAADDAAGHLFSFIFYATPRGARSIYEDIHASPVLAQLQAKGLVTDLLFDDPTHPNSRPKIEDTSDRHWPLLIQQTWPAYIMGASRMWLDLVSNEATLHADEPDLVHRYELVQQDIDRIWAENGQHAMLHHLDALFAYQPMLIRY